MTQPPTQDALPNVKLQRIEMLMRATDTLSQPEESGEHSVRNHESKELWTDGSPDPEKIQHRMKQLLKTYLARPPPRIDSGRFRNERYFAALRRAQDEFYGEMHYLDDLLYATPVLPLQAESTTTIVPYTPAPKRRRGRPATGIKPRDRRVNKDDDSY